MIYQKPKDLEQKIKDWKEPEFSEGALGILEKRYLMRDDEDRVIETPKEMLYRVSHVVALADSKYRDFNPEESEKKFYDLMAERKFFPNSPTLRGAGLGINLAACYVLPIEDSREGIFIDGVYGAVAVQAFGGGTGFNFSKIRPKDSLISTTRGKASGPISFERVIDFVIGEVIKQGGTRHGANMGILEYWHPDIKDFITCKNDGGIRNFNISVGVTEEFMEMVKNDGEYELSHPKWNKKEKVRVREIYDMIVQNAWNNGDPGIVFLDRLNRDNPTPALGEINATNPCGEQPLLPLEACNLGSINLEKFVVYTNDGPSVDYESLSETVYHAVHFLEDVIDVNTYPLEKPEKDRKELEIFLNKTGVEQSKIEKIIEEWSESPIEKMVKGNRKIGLGVMGFANMLISLGVPYGSEESYQIAEDVMSFINKKSKEASIKLAESRGVFPNWKESIFNPESEYFKGEEMRLRHATTTTIAPTGTLSTLARVEGAIEPLFGIGYTKYAVHDYEDGSAKVEIFEINEEFKKIAEKEGFYSQEFVEKIQENKGSLEGLVKPIGIEEEKWGSLKKIFLTAHHLPVEIHVGMQAAFQKYTDNAVSKTINMPKEAPKEWVEKAFELAYEKGLKGITIYRDSSKKGQVRVTGKTEVTEGDLMNKERPEVIGKTIPQMTPHGKAYVTLNVREDDHSRPYEAFIAIGKGGKDMSAIGEGFGRLVSLALQYNVPIEELVGQLNDIGGETQILGRERITSLPDALAKGVAEAYNKLNTGKRLEGKKNTNKNTNFSGNFCHICGCMMKPDGGCQVCTNPDCGESICG